MSRNLLFENSELPSASLSRYAACFRKIGEAYLHRTNPKFNGGRRLPENLMYGARKPMGIDEKGGGEALVIPSEGVIAVNISHSKEVLRFRESCHWQLGE